MPLPPSHRSQMSSAACSTEIITPSMVKDNSLSPANSLLSSDLASDELTEPDFECPNAEQEAEEADNDPAAPLRIKRVLYDAPSSIQQVAVVETYAHGNVLLLNRNIMLSEFDEFSYQEMITHLPMASHPDPREVLVIGGGDGGVLREIARWESVERIVLVEIDKDVIAVSKRFFPNMAGGFEDPRVEIIVGDGFAYLETCKDAFDVIITDSSGPDGPARVLFGQRYYDLLCAALKSDGTLCSQADSECNKADNISGQSSIWASLTHVKDMVETARGVFSNVEYGWSSVPTYYSCVMLYILASKDGQRRLKRAVENDQARKVAEQCRYWSLEMHAGAFVLPAFARRAIG